VLLFAFVPPTLGSLVVGLIVLAAVFGVLERWQPAVWSQPRWRKDTPTDIAYWFFTPLVTRAISRVAVTVAVIVLAAMAGVRLDREHVTAFATAPGRLAATTPVWLQVVIVLLAGDLVGYWSHRMFHGRRLWRFHAVHHSSTQVDWLSSVRLHPVNDAVAKILQALPFLLLGFRPAVIAAYLPFLTFHAIFLHANVPWTFGPLRYVISSPAFHRWHHTTEREGLDKNFAGLFPFFDLVFGTFYMPTGRQPMAFGILGEPVPTGLLAQLRYPFRRRAAATG
jgi:sterol desaturase/sphingolipid hydroxylase (fatty acid hydroxylase superfamily)